MANLPSNRVQDILKRMDENSSQPEAIKTCFGILAIMSRDESNKGAIAKEGMEIILNAMTMHVDKCDVQESGCDLLWSLAFNSTLVKEYIAKFGGATVLVRALKRHCRYADFLKSACGALSNMCQCKLNQEGVAAQGGLQPLVGAIHAHHTNFKLLPFLFDALASLIVGNEENAKSVSSLGVIPLIISALGRHKAVMDVIKSGCHTLAILTDLKSQASKIALAGGVPVILSLLDTHPSYADLHRVAAVVLLRMLQESAHVARDITTNEGVKILLKSIERGGAQQDTVAAVTHILFSVTNPASPASSCIEPQLWIPNGSSGLNITTGSGAGSSNGSVGSHKQSASDILVSLGGRQFVRPSSNADGSAGSISGATGTSVSAVGGPSAYPNNSSTALGGIVKLLGQYTERKDVVRAACRLLNNLGGYNGVVVALEKLSVLDKLLECASIHTETKDVIDSSANMLKLIHKQTIGLPQVRSHKAACMKGLLLVFRSKLGDEETVAACADTFAKRIESCCKGERSKDLEEWRSPQGKTWEAESVTLAIKALDIISGVAEPPPPVGTAKDQTSASSSSSSSSALVSGANSAAAVIGISAVAAAELSSRSRIRPQWTKYTPKAFAGLLNLSEATYYSMKLQPEPQLQKELIASLKEVSECIPSKYIDLMRRLEKLLGLFEKQSAAKHNAKFAIDDDTVSTDGLLSNNIGNASNGSSGSNSSNGASNSSSRDRLGSSSGSMRLTSQQQQQPQQGLYSSKSKLLGAPDGMGLAPVSGSSSSSAASGNNGGSPMLMLNSFINISQETYCRGFRCPPLPKDRNDHGNEFFNAGIIIEGIDHSTSNHSICLFPKHPLKYFRPSAAAGAVSSSSSRSKSTSAISKSQDYPTLLDVWPNYLERLLPTSPSRYIGAAFDINNNGGGSGVGSNIGGGGATGGAGGGSVRMHRVYEGSSAGGRGVPSRCPPMLPYDVPNDGIGPKYEHSLTFDSDFESGNLHMAVQTGDATYDLFLRADMHTAGHTQWFYFAVSNTHPPALVRLAEQGVQVPPVRVRFNIVNLTKPDSLYNLGMRPVVYSCRDAAADGIGWLRAGYDISYFANNYARGNTAGEGVACYYTLSFSIEFKHAKDTVLIAYSYPYTLTDYKVYMRDTLAKPHISDILRISRLCTTLGGENCDLWAITDFTTDKERIGPISYNSNSDSLNAASGGNGSKDQNSNFYSLSNLGNNFFATGSSGYGNSNSGVGGYYGGYGSSNSNSSSIAAGSGGNGLYSGGSTFGAEGTSTRGRPPRLKPALFISGRVHPGETPASWMMKGILDFLTSSCPAAMHLRQEFVLFIVPMLNPDGVVFGNNRCGLAGVDLNRQWKTPVKSLHPTIYYLKNFMAAQRKLREVHMYIDLHGHSRKYNVFMYGCDDKKTKSSTSTNKATQQASIVRAFPKLFSMHEIGSKYLNFNDCSFQVRKGRESTARVVVSRELNIPCSFTLEATFCGLGYGPLKHCHMNIGHMCEVGAAMCDAMLQFCVSESYTKEQLLVSTNSKLAAYSYTGISGYPDSDTNNISSNNSASVSTSSKKQVALGTESSSNTSSSGKSFTALGAFHRLANASGLTSSQLSESKSSASASTSNKDHDRPPGPIGDAASSDADDNDSVARGRSGSNQVNGDDDVGSGSGSDDEDEEGLNNSNGNPNNRDNPRLQQQQQYVDDLVMNDISESNISTGAAVGVGIADENRLVEIRPRKGSTSAHGISGESSDALETIGGSTVAAGSSGARIPRRPHSNDDKITRIKSLRQNNLVTPSTMYLVPGAAPAPASQAGSGSASTPTSSSTSSLPGSVSGASGGGILPAFKPSQTHLIATSPTGNSSSPLFGAAAAGIISSSTALSAAQMSIAATVNASAHASGMMIRQLPSPRSNGSLTAGSGSNGPFDLTSSSTVMLSKDDSSVSSANNLNASLAQTAVEVTRLSASDTLEKVIKASTKTKKKKGGAKHSSKKKKGKSVIVEDAATENDSDDGDVEGEVDTLSIAVGSMSINGPGSADASREFGWERGDVDTPPIMLASSKNVFQDTAAAALYSSSHVSSLSLKDPSSNGVGSNNSNNNAAAAGSASPAPIPSATFAGVAGFENVEDEFLELQKAQNRSNSIIRSSALLSANSSSRGNSGSNLVESGGAAIPSNSSSSSFTDKYSTSKSIVFP